MAYIPAEYQWVDEPNTWGQGTHKRQVEVRAGYTDMNPEYQYQAAMAQAAALMGLMNSLPAAPSVDVNQAVSNYYANHGAKDVANTEAELARQGRDSSSFGGGELGMLKAQTRREAADYGNQVAMGNYDAAMRGWQAKAGLLGQIGNLNMDAAKSRDTTLSDYASRQAAQSFKPYDQGASGIGQKALGVGLSAAGNTLPYWGPAVKNWAGGVYNTVKNWAGF